MGLDLGALQHPDPIGKGLACESFVELEGPDCIIPGQIRPIKLLGLQVTTIVPLSSLFFLQGVILTL